MANLYCRMLDLHGRISFTSVTSGYQLSAARDFMWFRAFSANVLKVRTHSDN